MGFLQVTTQLKQTSLASLETDRAIHYNEQRRINDLVEIVVAEVTGLQLYRLKIWISCRQELFSAVYFWPENFELIFVCNQSPANLSNEQFYRFTHWCQWSVLNFAFNKFFLKARHVPRNEMTVPYCTFLILQYYWYEYFIILWFN